MRHKIFIEYHCPECECSYMLGIVTPHTQSGPGSNHPWVPDNPKGDFVGEDFIEGTMVVRPCCPWCENNEMIQDCKLSMIVLEEDYGDT